jgi:cytoskeletal protein CcmA (bactofilin family)
MNDQSAEAEGCFTVGAGVSVKGTFSVPQRAIINGTVEGEITAKELLVGTSGKITGKVSAEIVDVHGEVNDTLNASKALILRASGRAQGAIAQLRSTLTVNTDKPVPATS